ncbi:response regulator [Epilithonimonas sp.]|uniref:response regulator transcription factor n=1 Tax=Epilithonimonas sp. TaxID=2894511 RepID=UPI0035B0EC24
MIRIGIVDDHQLFLDGIYSILSTTENIDVVFTTNNAKDAIQQINKIKTDILITDISMPEMNGLELTHHIKKNFPDIKIIVMSSFRDLGNRSIIDSYLLKNTPKELLINVINDLHYHNKKYYYSEQINFQEIDLKKNILSPREKEIVAAIAKGFSSTEIANKLFISINTVETHRKNIFFKLGISNTAQLISTAIKLGIIDY